MIFQLFKHIMEFIFLIIFTVLLLVAVWKSKETFSKPFALKILDDGKGLEIGIFWIAMLSVFFYT